MDLFGVRYSVEKCRPNLTFLILRSVGSLRRAHTGFIRQFISQFIRRLPLATDSPIVRIERFIRVY